MRLHQDLHNAINENESLQNELSRSRDECHQERQRAAEAELIASESEIVRDGLFSSYGALTEANVELERDLEEAKAEKLALERDLQFAQEEIASLENQCNIFHEQSKAKDSEVVEMQKKVDAMHAQLTSHRQSLEQANIHRHRLQDELHASQRNAVSTSQQLLSLRDQLTTLQKEAKRNSTQEERDILKLQLQQEQLTRKQMEGEFIKLKSEKEACQDQMKRLARTNAELKSRANELSARLESSDCISSRSGKSWVKNDVGDVSSKLLDYLRPDFG